MRRSVIKDDAVTKLVGELWKMFDRRTTPLLITAYHQPGDRIRRLVVKDNNISNNSARQSSLNINEKSQLKLSVGFWLRNVFSKSS